MISVNGIFEVLSGNSGITEEFIYSYVLDKGTKYQVLSSSTINETKLGFIPQCNNLKGELISIFENKMGILVARNGKAGLMAFLDKKKYTINDHAYILYLKEDFKKINKIHNDKDEEIFLKWFIYKYQNNVYEYSSKSDNGTWNKTGFMRFMEIEIDNAKTQLTYFVRYNEIVLLNNKLFKIQKEIDTLLNKPLSLDLSKYINTIKISEILSYKSRNDALSEEGIYNNVRNKEDDVISVLSGSLSKEIYGEIGLKTNNIHILNNQQGLVVTSRGKAGKLRYLKKGTYATNTNAFIFYINEDIKKTLNIKTDKDESVYLKFLKIYLEPIFISLSSNSDVAVFPLTKIYKEMEFPLFKLNKEIKDIVVKYESINTLKMVVDSQMRKLNKLLIKEVEL
jgi:hypothetical protein